LYCFSAVLPSVGTLTVLQVPLSGFKKFFHSIRTSHLVYKVEIGELVRFRDSVVHFFDDFALLVKAGFPCPASEELQQGAITFRADMGWPMVARIDSDGIAIHADVGAFFTKVSKRFREIFANDRIMLRRAAQLLISLSRFEQSFVTAICEVVLQLQRDGWATAIDWGRFFTDAKVSPDGTRIALSVHTRVDALELELARVAQKLQIIVGARSCHRMFSTLRGLIQWLSESDPDRPWSI
jgi:hypothetical protein